MTYKTAKENKESTRKTQHFEAYSHVYQAVLTWPNAVPDMNSETRQHQMRYPRVLQRSYLQVSRSMVTLMSLGLN